MTELYERLGVSPDDDLDTIKLAYRNLSKTHHPDVGGDQNTFALIAEAWEVLGNSVKRKQYDRTGVIPEPLDRAYHEALGFLAHLTDQAITQILDKNLEDLPGDLVSDMKRFIQEKITEAEQTLHKLKISPMLYAKMREKIHVKDEDYDGPNPILGAIDQREAKDGKRKEQVENSLVVLNKATEILDKFGCDFPRIGWQSTATAYTVSW